MKEHSENFVELRSDRLHKGPPQDIGCGEPRWGLKTCEDPMRV